MSIEVFARAETPPTFALDQGEPVFIRATVECDAGTMVQVVIETTGFRETRWVPRSEVVKVVPTT